MRIGRACHGAVQCHTLHAMVHEGIAHGTDGGGTRMEDMCCTMTDSNHCHRFACSIMLQLGSRAPIVIKWPAVVLVIWPHFNGNAQRRPRSASLGLALFSSRVCCNCFLYMHKPRVSKRKIKSAEGLPKNLGPDSVLFGRLSLAFLWSIDLSTLGLYAPSRRRSCEDQDAQSKTFYSSFGV